MDHTPEHRLTEQQTKGFRELYAIGDMSVETIAYAYAISEEDAHRILALARPNKALRKFTRSDVLSIRAQYAAGETTKRAIAEAYGASASTIGQLINGQTYKRVAGPITERSRR